MPSSPEPTHRYLIEEIVGRGAMGVVYRARDPLIGRVVALKTIELPQGQDAETIHDCLARFQREGQAAGHLSHPNIVTVYDVGGPSSSGTSWIAMEFVEGQTLREIVPQGERRPPDEMLEIAMQIARALDYAHRRGVIHRDVKPSNILVRDDGLVKLTDFGVARMDVSDLTRTGYSVGSPSYISPEALRDEPLDGRSDLFSLGVVLYEVLTGEKPFRGESISSLYHRILSSTPPPPSRANPEIGVEWDAVVLRLLAKSPSDRYASAAALIEDLRAIEQLRPPRFALAASGEPHRDFELQEDLELPEVVPDHIIEEGARAGEEDAALSPQRKALLSIATIAGFGLAVMVAAALMGRGQAPGVAPGSSPPLDRAAGHAVPKETAVPPRPVSLTIKVAHTLKGGRIAISLDNESLLAESFKGERSGIRTQGSFARTLRIAGGSHVFRVHVEDEKGRTWSQATTRRLAAGSDAMLFINLHGVLRRELDLTWGTEASAPGE